MIYFIMDEGHGAYVEAQDGDPLYNPETCILVTKKPTDGGYVYNIESGQWELTMASQQAYIRGLRNPEIARTDKYMLEDFPLTPEERAGAIIYREELREAPDKPTPQEMVMPVCPPYLEPKI